MTLSNSPRRSSGPLDELFSISLDAAVDLLEILEDTSSVADPVEVVVFTNDRDAVHYRLRWGNARHLIDNIWTIPPGTSANSWIAQNAPDSDLGEWASVWFPTAKRRERFWSALMQASGMMGAVLP